MELLYDSAIPLVDISSKGFAFYYRDNYSNTFTGTLFIQL